MTGYAMATAFAAPVEDGMMFALAARPARQSLPFMDPSTVSCEAVAACTVVMRPCLMPNFSLIVLTSGARPLVVHEAHETTCMDAGSYSSVSTPTSFHGISDGARTPDRVTVMPLTMSELPSAPTSHVPEKRPCTVSYSSKYLRYSGARAPLMCLSTNASRSIAMRTTWRPMRPKPLTPTLIGAFGLVDMPIGAAARESMAAKQR